MLQEITTLYLKLFAGVLPLSKASYEVVPLALSTTAPSTTCLAGCARRGPGFEDIVIFTLSTAGKVDNVRRFAILYHRLISLAFG
jgi:hypothetical protein